MLSKLTQHCHSGHQLNDPQCAKAVDALLDPRISDSEKADFLLSLAEKGETPAELAAFTQVLLPYACDPGLRGSFQGASLFDCCGTGGGNLNLINVSTALMFILSSGTVPVVKHGNRGITKKSGSADVLEALGAHLTYEPSSVAGELKRVGMAFCFAPAFHPAFRHINPVRKQLGSLGKRCIFNLLGPLLNPCVPDTQMIGVFEHSYLDMFSECLALLGRKRYLVVYGEDSGKRPIGEVSSIGLTRLVGSLDGVPVNRELYSSSPQPVDAFLVSGAEESAARLKAVFRGDDRSPLRDLLVTNAGVGFYVNGVAKSISEGESKARSLIECGQVQNQLKRWLE